MKAMILAAGLGERMRPLTDHTPKPLLRVGGSALIEYHLRGLAAAGFREVVINVSHLANQIEDFCRDGSQWGLNIRYSPEVDPLETAGGIVKALPLLGDQPFAVVNGDIWTDFPLCRLHERILSDEVSAHLVLVDNPAHHPGGDFELGSGGRLGLLKRGQKGFTYSGIAIFSPAFFAGLVPEKTPLRPLFEAAIERGEISGELYSGGWEDVGTPERLAALDAALGPAV